MDLRLYILTNNNVYILPGFTFSSPRRRSDPQEVITEITNLYPNRSADAFYYPKLAALPPIARVQIKLIRTLRGMS